MREIKMQYPKGDKDYFDGLEHTIIPTLLCETKYKNLYLLFYKDLSLKKDAMYTILRKDLSGKFYKVPLRDYENLDINSALANPISIEELPDRIGLDTNELVLVKYLDSYSQERLGSAEILEKVPEQQDIIDLVSSGSKPPLKTATKTQLPPKTSLVEYSNIYLMYKDIENGLYYLAENTYHKYRYLLRDNVSLELMSSYSGFNYIPEKAYKVSKRDFEEVKKQKDTKVLYIYKSNIKIKETENPKVNAVAQYRMFRDTENDLYYLAEETYLKYGILLKHEARLCNLGSYLKTLNMPLAAYKVTKDDFDEISKQPGTIIFDLTPTKKKEIISEKNISINNLNFYVDYDKNLYFLSFQDGLGSIMEVEYQQNKVKNIEYLRKITKEQFEMLSKNKLSNIQNISVLSIDGAKMSSYCSFKDNSGNVYINVKLLPNLNIAESFIEKQDIFDCYFDDGEPIKVIRLTEEIQEMLKTDSIYPIFPSRLSIPSQIQKIRVK